MITYRHGNLLEAGTDALVNTVNELGVMGKGVALQFREAFPESSREYQQAAKAGRIKVGRVFVTRHATLFGPRVIIHFPTKRDWKHPSRLEWVREGLKDLVRVVLEEGITSIALPPLGCGNGGLEWSQVRPIIENELKGLSDIEIVVFEPTTRYLTESKKAGVGSLTPARALIAEFVRRYALLDLECSLLEIQKLAWFLSRVTAAIGLEDPLKLNFAAHRYGPYADRLRFLLDSLDGSYLHSERRLGDARPLDHIWFAEDRSAELATYFASREAREYSRAIDEAINIVKGFESPLGLELLATVDWLLSQSKATPNVESIREALQTWPGDAEATKRKVELFDDRLLALALDRLRETILAPAAA